MAIPGWTAGSTCGGIEVQNGIFAVHPGATGTQVVELASNCPSAMYADLRTVPGQRYRVSYWYEPRPDSSNDNAITSSWDGIALETATGRAGDGWSQRTFEVVASGSSSVLRFAAGAETGSVGGLLDDVSVIPDLGLCSLNQVGRSFRAGATAPFKVQLCDATGQNVSSPDVRLHAGQPVRTDTTAAPTLDDSGAANSPSLDFRYDADLGGYVFNLSLKAYAPGTYTMPVTVSNGGGTYTLTFDVR